MLEWHSRRLTQSEIFAVDKELVYIYIPITTPKPDA